MSQNESLYLFVHKNYFSVLPIRYCLIFKLSTRHDIILKHLPIILFQTSLDNFKLLRYY